MEIANFQWDDRIGSNVLVIKRWVNWQNYQRVGNITPTLVILPPKKYLSFLMMELVIFEANQQIFSF